MGDSSVGDVIQLGEFEFERVREFRYLGVVVDEQASVRTMVDHMVTKSRQAFGALCEFVGT